MNLQTYIESLRQDRQIQEVDIEVDARLELACLTDQYSGQNRPGLIFKRIRQSPLTLASNLFGSDRRMAMALGHESLFSFGQWLTKELCRFKKGDSAGRLRQLLAKARFESKTGSLSQRENDLGFVPGIRYWPQEKRSFMTLAVVVSRAPDSEIHNAGIYRVGVAGNRSLTLNLLPGSGAGEHLALWQREEKAMPVAILLGADPALIFAAACSLPGDCSELNFSGIIQRAAVQVADCQTLPLRCPTSAQILLEGWVDPCRTINEGPFGCYRGDYGGANECPLVEISLIATVADPLLPVTLAGPLPQEDCWIAKAELELIRVRLAVDLPEITQLAMPLDAAFYGIYFVSCQSEATRADTLAEKIQNLGYLRRLQMLVVLPEDKLGSIEKNWRSLLSQTRAEQVWRKPDADLERVISRSPAVLSHDKQMLDNLLRRLSEPLT